MSHPTGRRGRELQQPPANGPELAQNETSLKAGIKNKRLNAGWDDAALLKGDLRFHDRLTPEGVGQHPQTGFHEQGPLVAGQECGTGRPFQAAHERFHHPATAVAVGGECLGRQDSPWGVIWARDCP